MQHYIQQYLLAHKKVSINGWGTLHIHTAPASVDFLNKCIHAPATHLVYNESADGDTGFVHWLAQELNISIPEASESLGQFVSAFKKNIAANKIVWNGWGSFETVDHSISFTPDAGLKAQPVVANRVIRKGAEHNIRVGEDERTNTQMEEFLHGSQSTQKYPWWIGGLILFVFGIILAALFAYKHNIQWKKQSNYHLLHPQEPPALYKIQ